MQLIEKVQELQAIQPPLETDEINRRIQEWKKQTNYEAPEKVKSTGAAKQTDANASPKETPEASESLGSGNGLSPSKKYNFLDLLKPKNSFNFGFSQPKFDKDYFNRKYKSLTGYNIDDLEPDEIFEGEGGYKYKYNLGESKDGKAPMNFYMKKPGEKEFVDLTTKYNKILKEDPEFKIEENIEFANSYASILSEMGYLPEDVKKDVIAQQEKIKKKNAEIKAFNKKQDTSRLYNERGLENYNNRISLSQAPNFYRIEEGETTVPEFFNMSAPPVESYENYIKTSETTGAMYGFDGATAKDKALARIEYEDLDLEFPFLYFKNSQKESSQLKGYDQNLLIEEFGGVKGLEKIGVNSDDFLGFLLYKGFAGDIVDAKQSGKFKDEPLMFQRQMQNYVNFYMQEMDHRYNTKQKMLDVIYDKDGKYEEYNTTSTTPRAMALKLPEYGKSEAKTIFDYGVYEAYSSVLFPDAFAKDKEYLAEKIKFNNTLDNRDDAASKLYATAEGLKNIPVAFYEEAWGLKNWVSDIIGADDIADRGRGRLAEINRRRASYQTYANFYGPTLEIEGTTYAIDRDDENETLWNVDEGYSVVGDASYIQKLTERVKKEGKVENHKSFRGYTTQGGTVFGSLLLQVVGTKGFGTASKGLRLTTGAALNGFGLNVAKYKRYKDLATAIGGSPTSKFKLPIKASTVDNIMFQGMYGAYTGYETILSESLANGLDQEEAQELANTGSLTYGSWYAATGPINNKGGWFDDIIGKRTLQNTVKRAIGKYKSEGYNGFINSFQKSLLKLSAKASKFVEQGVGETVQENTQQEGEALINKYLNYKFDVSFLDDTYTQAEIETTSGLSFVTAGIMSSIKMPNFKGNSKNNLLDYQYIGQNATEAEKIALQLVESGLATQQDVTDMLENAKAVINQTPRIPKWLDDNLAFDVAKLMQERQNLENSKKNIDKSFHQNIDDRIENINLEIDGYVRPAADAQRAKLQAGVESFLNKIRKAKGKVDMVSFDTTAEANAYRQELLEQGAEIMQSDNYGDMVVTPEGNKILIVDNQINTEDNVVTTGLHEGGHFVLSETIDQDPDAAKKMGNALVDEMFENENVTIKSNKIKRRLATYASQGTPTAVMMEEIMMMVSEGLINGDIEFNETAKTRIGDLIRRTLQNVFGIKVKFKDGEDVLNFLRDYNRTIQTERGGKAITRVATEGAKVDIADPGIEAARKIGRVKQEIDEETGQIKEVELDEVDLGVVSKESKRQINPEEQAAGYQITKQASDFIEAVKDGLITNEQLIETAKPEARATPEQRIAAQDALLEANWPIISKSIKFDPSGQIPQPFIKLAVQEMFRDTFPGRGVEAKFFNKFDPKLENKATTFIDSQLRNRIPEILERAKVLQSEKQDLGIEKAGGVIDTSATKTATTKETKVAKKPTETVKYSDAIIEKAGVKNKAELETKITEATKKSFKDVDVERFGQTKDVPPAIAKIYGEMLGLNPETISDKTRTYQNYDEAGLNAAQRFLLANATNDFARLPKTKDETTTTGRGTFIPKNMKDALYTDGRLTGTLKNYMDLIRSKPTGKLYRDSKYAQLIRGLLNTHIRNRMFEDLVPTTPQRLRGGAKFSKRIEQSLPETKKSQIQNIGKAISGLEDLKLISTFANSVDDFIDAIAVDDYNVEAAFNEVYGADFLTKKNGDPTTKKTNLINEWIKVRQSGKGLKDFVKQTPSEITMRDYLYQAFDEQTESEVVENILGIKKGGVDFRSKDQIMGYVNLMNNYIASKYGKLNDKEIAEFVINELAPSLSAGAKVAGNDFMWELNQDTGLLRLVPSTLKRTNSIRASVFSNLKQVSKVLIEPFLSEASKNKLTYEVNKPLWEGKPLKKGQVAQKVNTYVTSLKETGGIRKELLDKSAEFAQQKIETIVDFLNWYKSQGSNKEITVDMLGMAFRGFNGDMTALVRAAARVNSFAGDGTGPQRYEHNPPARTMLVRMAEYVNGNITEQQLRDYFSNYTVSIIPKLMDDVVNERYKDTSPLIGSRYYNAFTYGRFPFAMTKYVKQDDGSYKKTTIGEYQKQAYKNANKIKKANSGMAPKALMSKRATNQEVISDLGTLDNALNQARRPDAPVKKIRVFDFDDTLARSKSQVLYTVPNVEGGFSEGATKLKAIFMVGGPGAGKTNVGKGLQLGRRGYKVVNQDIALEAMKSEAGLPAKESDYTAEQRSTRSKLGAAARKAAVAKFDKYAAAGNGMVIDGTGASYNATTKKIKALQDAGYEVHMVVATTPLETALQRNKARVERSLPDFVVEKTYENVQESLKKYREDFGDRLYEINTENIEYGKPLPNDFLQQVYDGINTNKVGKVDATSFAENYDVLESQGAEFDFREFSKVIEGKKGPLFSVAQKIAAARGTDDVFILTARPADAAKPIQEFMKANGIDIPLQNITGLGDGTAAAKGRWIAGKAAEGYNDFYFADDAIKNVQAVKEVLSQVDVKSKVQQAKASKRITFDKVFNDIIEQKTGIESYKQFSAAKAKTVGASKGKFTFFTTPSAEDFLGLLYKTLGKGKVGDAQMAFYKENLLDPFNRAEMAISQAKVAAGRDYKALKKQFKNIPKTLEKETGIAKYTYQHAIRTYIWDSQGLEVPGLSKRDQKRLTDFIKADPELQAFADQLVTIQKGKPYPKPDKDWTAGNITTDVISGINKVNRAEYLQEWQENVDIIFSEKNMNKLEAAFGAKYVEALKDSLRAMKSGSNRPLGGDRVSNGILDWLNNSVGAIMFLNTRSAVLQTISAVNFINWGDNNILKAGKAFANQKQFWSDFLTLMNSDYLLERRDGLKINVSESEIADAVEGSKNKVNAAISFLLNKGFVFTRYADSFAIASGGATFYRNRIESLVEQGMDRKLAEKQAFEDFRLIAEENQQSSSPMRISQQQRSLIGRIILQFGNTQLQYVRIQKRAVQDLVNGRGDWRSNISKIVYYGAIQNLLFNALQSGLAWALFDDDEDDDEEKAELTKKNKEQKLQRALNGAIDSQLKGLGIQGAVVSGVKNALLTIAEEADKKSPKFEEALDDLLSIAPALGSKIRKIKSAARTVSWNRKEIKEKGFSMDNPAYLAGAQTISAVFNIPLDRAVMKMNNMRNILNPATENWQKVALALGWSTWDVGLPYFGLAEDKPVLTETEKQTEKLFDLNKSDQVKMLLDLGLTKKEIRALTKEEQRVQEIIKLQNKKKNGKDKS